MTDLLNDGVQVATDTPVFSYAGAPGADPKDGGTSVWTPGDATLATLTPAADGFSATVVAVAGAVGSYSYTYTYTTKAGTALSYSNAIDVVAPVAVPDAVASDVTISGT